MRKVLCLVSLLLGVLTSCQHEVFLPVGADEYDLSSDSLATRWDEAMPLGNATIGSLVWQKRNNLRISIDRSDLWDLRPTEELTGDGFLFAWLYSQVKKGDYAPVQERFDDPYSINPGPCKIPGAGMELPIQGLGEVSRVHLYQRQAVCEVVWQSGASLQCFVHAEKPVGWFVLSGVEEGLEPLLVPPTYNEETQLGGVNDHSS